MTAKKRRPVRLSDDELSSIVGGLDRSLRDTQRDIDAIIERGESKPVLRDYFAMYEHYESLRDRLQKIIERNKAANKATKRKGGRA